MQHAREFERKSLPALVPVDTSMKGPVLCAVAKSKQPRCLNVSPFVGGPNHKATPMAAPTNIYSSPELASNSAACARRQKNVPFTQTPSDGDVNPPSQTGIVCSQGNQWHILPGVMVSGTSLFSWLAVFKHFGVTNPLFYWLPLGPAVVCGVSVYLFTSEKGLEKQIKELDGLRYNHKEL